MAADGPSTPVSINWGAVLWQLGDDHPSDNHEVDLSHIDHIHTKYEGVEPEDFLESILSTGHDVNHSELPPSVRKVYESAKDFTEKEEVTDLTFQTMEELLEHVDPSFIEDMMNGLMEKKNYQTLLS